MSSRVYFTERKKKSAGRKQRKTSRSSESAAPRTVTCIIMLVQCTRTFNNIANTHANSEENRRKGMAKQQVAKGRMQPAGCTLPTPALAHPGVRQQALKPLLTFLVSH